MKNNVLAYFLTGLILGAGLVGLFWYMQKEEPIGATAPNAGFVTNNQFLMVDMFATNATSSEVGFKPTTYGYNATTSSATSTTADKYVDITGAKRVTAYFSRTGFYQNEGSSTFHLEIGQRDIGVGTTVAATTENDLFWVDYNKLIDNITNATANNPTRVTFSALTGTSTKIYSMDLTSDVIRYVRCIVVEAVDGETSCQLLVQY